MEKKIKWVEKGDGEGATFFSTEEHQKNACHFVDEIKEFDKIIGKGYYNDLTILTYQGFKNDKLVFEIESNSSITITYY